ncbi:hypothetical protein [Saccharibacillus brassicae]|uniref:Flagellar protein FliT n=1 Tax=Saccharibacillus brassicae TaxID=2583377 RepID=A0A4Y6UWU0_SACBS|nr:hypothetical protein [Saccharibacillus brassicae]QDH20841.1 hypothetical protein FFV09_08260 [Saccharibacillus brassicae]
MDNWIAQLEELTHRAVNQVESMPYEEFEQFVEKRQIIIDQLESILMVTAANPQQKQRLSQVLQHDAILLNRMNTLKEEAHSKIQQRGQAKAQRSAYESHYSPEAILMDRRK